MSLEIISEIDRFVENPHSATVAPDIAAVLKNYIISWKERISGILFFNGDILCLRSRHLVLWSLGTLTGQQRFYGSGLVT